MYIVVPRGVHISVAKQQPLGGQMAVWLRSLNRDDLDLGQSLWMLRVTTFDFKGSELVEYILRFTVFIETCTFDMPQTSNMAVVAPVLNETS